MAKALRGKGHDIEQATWQTIREASFVLLSNRGLEAAIHETAKATERKELKPGYFVAVAKSLDSDYDRSKLNAPDLTFDQSIVPERQAKAKPVTAKEWEQSGRGTQEDIQRTFPGRPILPVVLALIQEERGAIA
jgi:hypothetical protein